MKPALMITLLVLTLPAFPAQEQEKIPPPADAASAEKAVTQALKDADGVPKGEITVSRHANALVLSGEVDSLAEKARAETTAETAAAGVRVSSHVEVRPDMESPSALAADRESALALANVEKALRDDPRTRSLGITVLRDESRVIGLHGLVPTNADRAEAERVAKRGAGSAAVRNHLILP